MSHPGIVEARGIMVMIFLPIPIPLYVWSESTYYSEVLLVGLAYEKITVKARNPNAETPFYNRVDVVGFFFLLFFAFFCFFFGGAC